MKAFVVPEVEIRKFSVEDVITTSGVENEIPGDGPDNDRAKLTWKIPPDASASGGFCIGLLPVKSE